jgi:hypothetical protein
MIPRKTILSNSRNHIIGKFHDTVIFFTEAYINITRKNAAGSACGGKAG